jgi:glutathione S-transferase
MRLYVTQFSPFARMARVVRLEKRLEERVNEDIALTRTPNSSYYKINPSGRVPYLVSDDGVGIEGSQQVCFYLDQLDGSPTLETPEGKAGMTHRRLEEYARSLVEGVSVWVRELRRAPEDRSEAIIEHERQRLSRLADFWEIEIDHPIMGGGLNMPQLTLACGLLLEEWYSGLEWRKGRPRLAAWTDTYAGRKSFVETRPPEKLNPHRVEVLG